MKKLVPKKKKKGTERIYVKPGRGSDPQTGISRKTTGISESYDSAVSTVFRGDPGHACHILIPAILQHVKG